jgi:hypothetical protein
VASYGQEKKKKNPETLSERKLKQKVLAGGGHGSSA